MTCVIGIDPSLTSLGVARIVHGPGVQVADAVPEWVIDTWRVRSCGTAHDPLAVTASRLRDMVAETYAATAPCDLVVIEGLLPSTRARSGKASERAGLWWMLVDRVARADIPVVEVPPASLKRWACGYGRADKTEVRERMIRDWSWQRPSPSLDESDAWAAASLGAQLLSLPVPWDTTGHRAIPTTLTIPEGLENVA